MSDQEPVKFQLNLSVKRILVIIIVKFTNITKLIKLVYIKEEMERYKQGFLSRGSYELVVEENCSNLKQAIIKKWTHIFLVKLRDLTKIFLG